MGKKDYSGPEKAAIFLMALGEDAAAKILSEMEEREIQSLGNYISALGDVDTQTMDGVVKSFYQAVKTGTGGL